MNANDCTLYHGGLKGAETIFGENAEKYGIQEIIFSFEGHRLNRDRNPVMLSEEELQRGDISMELASRMMKRTYYETEKIRRVLQTIFHMVNNGYHVIAVGWIQPDKTVKGGTGWGVELAKLFNRPLSVYDQEQKAWFSWEESRWVENIPVITSDTFVGTGTRNLSDDARQALHDLYIRSFGPAQGQ